jgi:hypothetical protein
MFCAWLNRLSKNWFTPSAKRGCPHSRAGRVRPQLECLEERSTPAGLTLTNGNLYNTVAGQTKLIDTGVQSFAVVNNEVIDLHVNGTLERMNNDGSGKATLATGVQTLMQSSQGSGAPSITILTGGQLEQSNYGLTFSTINLGGPVTEAAAGQKGTAREALYALRSDGTLFEETTPGTWFAPWTPNHGEIVQLVADTTGEVYFRDTTGGLTAVGATGFTTVTTSGARELAARNDGTVFYINTAGNLWQHSAGSSPGTWSLSWTPNHGQIVQLASDGTAVYIYAIDGSVYADTVRGWTIVTTSTARGLAARDDGTLYYNDTGGNLWLHGFGTSPSAWSKPWTPNHGQIVQLASDGAAAYIFATDQSVYAEDSQGWHTVATAGANGLAARDDGNVYYVDSSGNLRQHSFGSPLSVWATPWTPNHLLIEELASDGAAIYFQTYDNNGSLYALDYQGWHTVATGGVWRMAGRADGTLYYVDSAGNLWQHSFGASPSAWSMPWTPNHGPITQLVTDGAAVYIYASDGSIYGLD